jgi:hypothetical protein
VFCWLIWVMVMVDGFVLFFVSVDNFTKASFFLRNCVDSLGMVVL